MICNACQYKMHRQCKGCPCQHQTGPGHVNPKALRGTLTLTPSQSDPLSPTSEAKSGMESQHR